VYRSKFIFIRRYEVPSGSGKRKELNPLGKQILGQLQENMEIAKEDQIPICQDTGMAIVFLNIGQDVHIEG
jgi:tartrate dehydratase alpha subunit/fumarate hydratase class I-like protein